MNLQSINTLNKHTITLKKQDPNNCTFTFVDVCWVEHSPLCLSSRNACESVRVENCRQQLFGLVGSSIREENNVGC